MGIEDEIHDRFCLVKFDCLNEKDARDIRTLIEKARSAQSRPQARWYLAWADQLAEKAREKVDKIFLFQSS